MTQQTLRLKKPSPAGRDLYSTEQWQAIRAALGLTHREGQVLQHLFDDESERQVARALGISEHTVHGTSFLANEGMPGLVAW